METIFFNPLQPSEVVFCFQIMNLEVYFKENNNNF